MNTSGYSLVSTLVGLSIFSIFAASLSTSLTSSLKISSIETKRRAKETAAISTFISINTLLRRAYNPYLRTILTNSETELTVILPEYEKLHIVGNDNKICGPKGDFTHWLLIEPDKIKLVRANTRSENDFPQCLSSIKELISTEKIKAVIVIPIKDVLKISLQGKSLISESLIKPDKQTMVENLEHLKLSYDSEYFELFANQENIKLHYPIKGPTWLFAF